MDSSSSINRRRRWVLSSGDGAAMPQLPVSAAGASSGGSIYAALLGRCRRASVTRVDSTVSDADTFFPDLDALPNWKIERTGEAVTENGLTYRFVDYVNTAPL